MGEVQLAGGAVKTEAFSTGNSQGHQQGNERKLSRLPPHTQVLGQLAELHLLLF